VESAPFPPLALVPAAYPRRGVCVVAAGIHARHVGEKSRPPDGGARPGARALYGFVLSGGRAVVSCARPARQRGDARGRAGRDEWSAATERSGGVTAAGRAAAKREASEPPAARSAEGHGAIATE